MNDADKVSFAALIVKTWRFYGKNPTPDEAASWFELLEGFPLDAVAAAFKRHLLDSARGQYPPKPADVIRFLDGDEADDGRPGADEAWGMLLRLVRDERETGVLSEEMREGWAACGPILDAGDEVGARRCFIAAYESHVRDARQRREPARWVPTLGTCPQLRAQRLSDAVSAGRLGREHVAGLLAGPEPASIEQVAGLLAGPDAPRGAFDAAASLRGLAAMLRRSMADDEAERAAERARRKAAEDAERIMATEIAAREEATRRGEGKAA